MDVRNQSIRYTAILALIALAMTLAGCGEALPPDARETVLAGFELQDEPHISTAKQVDPLPKDLEIGAEEVWCVNTTFTCWSCDYGEYRTCADSRLVRRVGDDWQVTLVRTDEDREAWEARGCELIADVVAD